MRNMKKMKKIVSVIVAITLFFSAVPVYAAEAYWEQDEIGWRYVDETGNYVVSDWVVITEDGGIDEQGEPLPPVIKYYYIKDDGYMVTGWYQIGEDTYYFGTYGARHSGWLQDAGKWYYFAEDGKMAVGFVQVEDDWYLLSETGEMLTGWQKVDGEWKYFNKDGRWIDDTSAIENTIMGIDVSYWQEKIDWDAVKGEGVQFTFIRVGHGDRKLDTRFKENISEANRVGIPAGVYFYSTAQTEEEALLDAQFVIDSVQGYTISYPIVIDMEDASQIDLGKEKITDMVIAFCDEIRAAGYTPMIYCNENWYKNYIDFERLGDIERWIARYAVKGSSNIQRDIWQAGSTTRLNGIKGNADIDFAYTDYTKIIVPRTESDPTYEKTTGYWETDETGKWFKHLDGTYTTKDWELIQGEWYYFDEEGYLVTDQWLLLDGDWYYVDEEGIRTTGWALLDDKWYYFDELDEGTMKIGWQYINGRWYYLSNTLNDGSMKTGWQKIGSDWYYLDENSGALQSDWQLINGEWYYFGDSNDGAMKIGWQLINGNWYYLSNTLNDGAMKTGWQWINGDWYYMDETGSGAMQTGWQSVNGKWYFMYANGKMASGTWVDNYYVNKSGVWTKTR